MKYTTAYLKNPQPTQPIELPQLPTSLDTPTELLIYLTLLLTIGTNTLKSANHFLIEFKKLIKQWKPDCPKKSPNPKKRSKP